GVLLCAFACFTVLPSLLMVFDRRPSSGAGVGKTVTEGRILPDLSPGLAILSLRSSVVDPRSPGVDSWLPFLAKRPRWIIGPALALTAVLAVCASRVVYDHNLLHLQASDLDSVKWELTLIEHTAGASWHAISYTASPEEALALKARYEQLPEVSRVVE